jgi:hypothetical protein
MRDVHMLHHTQSVTMLDESSALRRNMPQHNDEEGGKQPRLSFSPAASVWGKMGSAWTSDRRNLSCTTETITVEVYVAFFHQYFGSQTTLFLAPFANEQFRCQKYLVKNWVVRVAGTPWRSRRICWRTSPCATILSALVEMGG